MTEKRFVADNEYVMQDNQVYVVCGGEHSADVVATALNELLDENKLLKHDYGQLQYEMSQIIEEYNKLEIENEGLKQENKHLRCTIESNSQDDYIDYLENQNDRLKEIIESLSNNDKIVFMNCND